MDNKQEKFYYCQLQIEQDKWCKIQCKHCKEYYRPLEEEMKDKTFLEALEHLFRKKWNENIINLPCKMYRLGKETDSKNTSLWKQLRKKKL